MHSTGRAIVVLGLTCLADISFAQADKKLFRTGSDYLSKVKVTENSVEKSLAWCGGLNNPQFSMADLNHDGVQDLVIYETSDLTPRVLKTFLNKGTAGNPDYRYAPEYEYTFQNSFTGTGTFSFLKMFDYNCDGVPDLFTGRSGLYLNKGYYNSGNVLDFKPMTEVRAAYGNTTGNVGILANDMPGMEDIDGDGDLDVVSFESGFLLNTVTHFKNLGAPCDSMRLRLVDYCWGKFRQNQPREHQLQFSCEGLNAALKTTKPTDANNNICLFDADGDGDMDALIGNSQYPDIQFLRNGRIDYGYPKDSMVSQDTMWHTGDHKLYMPSYPAAYWVDIDQDGDKDILISPQVSGENYHCIAYYKNTGSNMAPSFSFQTDSFLIDKMIDMGSNSYPVLYDYNKDGKKDLFIGANGFFKGGGVNQSAIYYLENTSTGSNISFNLVTRNFLRLDTLNIEGAAIAIGDLDNDGLDELLLGHKDGTISYYKNYAASASAQPVWMLYQKRMKDASNADIDASDQAAPFIYDMDNDGKKDLIIGNITGYIRYYQNTSGGLVYKTNKLGGVKVQPDIIGAGSSAPYIGRINDVEKDYLMVGGADGRIYCYDGFQGNVTTPYTLVDSFYSEIQLPGRFSTPAFGDVNNDGLYELYIGNEKGGVFAYRQMWPAGIDDVMPVTGKLKIYPNPAQNSLQLSDNSGIAANAEIRVYNSMGSVMSLPRPAISVNTAMLNIESLPPGVYLCVVSSNGKMRTGTFIKR